MPYRPRRPDMIRQPADRPDGAPPHAAGRRSLPSLPERAGDDGGRLIENVMYFARTLRRAGLAVGPGRLLAGIQAVQAVGLERRDDLYWALHAVFVNRRDQQELFDEAFHIFWRNPKLLERMMSLMLPQLQTNQEGVPPDHREISRRLAEALQRDAGGDDPGELREERQEFDFAMTFSDQELLQTMDFEKMCAEELSAARAAIQAMRLPIMDVRTRRFRPAMRGRRPDLRATLRSALRTGGDSMPLRWRKEKRRHPPLVVICDISGSMSRYSRMLLHFMHAVTNDRDRVYSFVFGTRLTNITRYLRQKDVDVAVEAVSGQVLDWSGGTRIGSCLETFNRDWARRVLGQGAVVLFISDGLDRDNAEGLAGQVERLHKSCRRLIWLNPLLRYEGYRPKSLGARAILPHVDEFRTVHNLHSLTQLAEVLSRPGGARKQETTEWRRAL